jgi:hypothetical protein
MADMIGAAAPLTTLDWVRSNLAAVLGLPADSSLAVPAPAGGAPNLPALRKLGDALGRRYRKVANPDTGQISFVTNGELLLPLVEDAETDPLVATLARSYVDGAKAALARIDSGMCIPGACPEDAENMVLQILTTLDALAAEAPRRGGRVQALMYLNDLANEDTGLLANLRDLIGGGQGGVRSLDRKRALQAIKAASASLHGVAAMLEELSNEGGRSLTEFADIIRRCASQIPERVRDVRRALDAARVSDCELALVTIKLDDPYKLGEENLYSLTLPEALRALEEAPGRWIALAAGSSPGGIDAISGAAEFLHYVVDAMGQPQILAELKLDPAAEGGVATSLRRLVGYTDLVIKEMQRADGAAGAGPVPVPAGDQEPL